MTSWRNVLSYGSFLSLAVQSSRWEQSMNDKLLEMAAAAQKAAALQISAADHAAWAIQAQDQAVAEQARAAELQEEAAVLFEKSEADAAIAAGEQIEVEELEAEVAVEEEQAVAHAAAAALDEVTFEGEMIEATADAAEAARMEAQARGEEVGIAICEFIPLLDVACDVIGGITAVGMEGLAASEAVKASTELVAATATKVEEEREIALATDFQVKAGEDAAAAAELQTEEVSEAEMAKEERLAGEEKEAEADALLEQAQVEEEEAAVEENFSAQQEEDATSLMANSLMKGVLSCWDGIMASAFAVVSFVFFSVRFLLKLNPLSLTIPVAAKNAQEKTGTVTNGESLWRDISYKIHHCALFTLMTGCFSNTFDAFPETSLQARGGVILGFAFTGACLQTFFLHSLPTYLSRSKHFGIVLLDAIRLAISLLVLYTLEILILWVAVGQRLFDYKLFRGLAHWQWWLLFLIPLGVHIWFFEIPLLRQQKVNSQVTVIPDNQVEVIVKETDMLLPTKNIQTASQATEHRTSWLTLLRQDLARMQLPFEVLVLSCITVLLIHCLGSIKVLWPSSKALLLNTRPNWLIPVVVGVGILATVGLTSMMFCRRIFSPRSQTCCNLPL